MYIYHKQCGILQKIQWKGSNGQLQWFNKATSGALCWKRQKTPKLGKLKRKLLKLLKGYDLYRGVPCESWRPGLSENVVVFEIWRFKTKVIGCQSRVKFREKILVERWCHKKNHGHNIEFWGLKRNQRGPNMVGSTLIRWQRSKLIIVAVTFFCDASYFW